MTRNKDYWLKDANGEQLPYLDAVNFVPYPDQTVRMANLKSGLIDVMLDPAVKDIPKLREDPDLDTYVITGYYPQGNVFDLARPPMSNLNFRKALVHSFDREAYVKSINFGLGLPWNGVVYPGHKWAYDAKRPPVKYDPQMAKQYLAKAIEQGIKPEWTITYGPTNPLAGKTLEAMQADAAAVGIKLNLLPDVNSLSRMFSKRDYDNSFAGGLITPDPFTKMKMYFGKLDGTWRIEKYTAGENFDTPEGFFAKSEALLAKMNSVYDPQKRVPIFYEFSDLVLDHVGGFFGVTWDIKAVVTRKNVGGIYIGPEAFARVERAWLKK